MDTPGRMLHLWGGKLKIERLRIPEYFTAYYDAALALYLRFKRYGLPFGGGYEEQPGWYIDLIDVFEAVSQMQPVKGYHGDSGRAKRNYRSEGARRDPRPQESR
jgi:hypothetical protein